MMAKIYTFKVPAIKTGFEQSWMATCDRYNIEINPYAFQSEDEYSAFCDKLDMIIKTLE